MACVCRRDKPSVRNLPPLALLSWILVKQAEIGLALSTTVGLYTTQSPLFQAPSALASTANVAYYGFYQIGTPGVYFRACFDTGSSSTWVPSTKCNSTACELHLRYNASESSTFQATSVPFTTSYVTGGVTGNIFMDTLTVGGISLPEQAMGLAEDESLDFALAICDGLFGLAFPGNLAQNLSAPFITMLKAGILDQPVFSMWLNPDTRDSYAGELKFGAIDKQRFFGNIRFTPITSDGPRYWQAALNSVVVGATRVDVAATSAIIDSGSTLIFASQVDAHQINMAVPSMQGQPSLGVYNLTDCSKLDTLPLLSFEVGGIRLQLFPQQYILQRSGAGMTTCTSAIVGVVDNPPYIVLGTPFLRAYYTAYKIPDVNNLSSAQIGFAAASGTGMGNATSFLGL